MNMQCCKNSNMTKGCYVVLKGRTLCCICLSLAHSKLKGLFVEVVTFAHGTLLLGPFVILNRFLASTSWLYSFAETSGLRLLMTTEYVS